MKTRVVSFLFLVFSFLTNGVYASAEFHACTSVAPVAFVMREVGAGYWDVDSLVEQGKNPHAFALTPKLAAGLSASRVYLAAGIEMDAAVAARAPLGMRVVSVSLPDAAGDDDPHLWLDPEGLVAIARASKDAFSKVDPSHKAAYADACAKIETDILVYTTKAARLLTSYKGRRFYVQHDAFTRYAARYGLKQVPIEENEKDPSAARLVEITRMMQADGTRLLYAQPGHNPKPLRVIADPLGAKILILDPLPADPVKALAERAEFLAEGYAVNDGK